MQDEQNSHWQDWSGKRPSFPKLHEELTADVVVVGAGITGLVCAWQLVQKGLKVVVLEAARLAKGTTGYSSAHISTRPDGGYSVIEKIHGEETAKAVFQSMKSGSNLIGKIASHLIRDCDYKNVPGYQYSENPENLHDLHAEFEACKRVGMNGGFIDTAPLPFPNAGGFRLDEQAQFNPVTFIYGVAELLAQKGCEIFEISRVLDINNDVVTTKNGKVTAQAIVLATHTPIGKTVVHTELKPMRSFITMVRVPDAEIPEALFWDDADPYHYIRWASIEYKVLVVGGCDIATGRGKEEDAFSALRSFVETRFSGKKEFLSQWSAQFYESTDHLPFIGRVLPTSLTFFGTGYSGDGLTFGALAGQMLSEQVMGGATQFDSIYKPLRLRARSIPELVKVSAHNAYDFVGDRMSFSKHVESLKFGEGDVISHNASQYAVYKDVQGELQVHSAVCPHLKCIVHWNSEQKSFDCPCHGSRFKGTGELIEGPALCGLEEATSDEFEPQPTDEVLEPVQPTPASSNLGLSPTLA